jgi:hypothetical protein
VADLLGALAHELRPTLAPLEPSKGRRAS